MTGGVADASDAIDRCHCMQQVGEVVAVVAIAVDVLPQQGDFLNAVLGQVNDLRQHIGQRPADFLAAGVGHHTEGAVLAAAFHDRDIGAGAVDARLGQAVELLDLREGNIHLRRPGGARGIDHFRQAVQCLRAEHHIDIGRAVADRRAFLAGDAAANADHQLRIVLFQFAPAAQLGKDLFLGLFADRAGIEEDHVGFSRILGDFHGLVFAQQVHHARAVVLVHLAAMGFDEKLAGHVTGRRCAKNDRRLYAHRRAGESADGCRRVAASPGLRE